jgi:hypothetical protein
MSGLTKTLARGAVLTAAGLLLAGCFDLTVDIGLKNDGSGTLTTEVVFSKEMTDTFKSTGGKIPQPKNVNGGRQTSTMRNGQMVQTNVMTFTNVSGLKMAGQALEVSDGGRTWFGAHRSGIAWSSGGKPGKKGEPPPDKNNPFYKAMMAQFAGHYVTVTMAVPCNVEHADPIKVNGKTVEPSVEGSWSNGATVRWKIPLLDMISDEHPSDSRFALQCWSWYGIVPGKSKVVAGAAATPGL